MSPIVFALIARWYAAPWLVALLLATHVMIFAKLLKGNRVDEATA